MIYASYLKTFAGLSGFQPTDPFEWPGYQFFLMSHLSQILLDVDPLIDFNETFLTHIDLYFHKCRVVQIFKVSLFLDSRHEFTD
jgi:hypothetical protein